MMMEVNKEFLNGIDELEDNENIKLFLKKILQYELDIYNSKGKTHYEIKEEYEKLISNFSQEDGNDN